MLEHGGSEDPEIGVAYQGKPDSPEMVVFVPLRRAGRRRRVLLWLIGPLAWVLGALIATLLTVVDVSIGEDPASFKVLVAWGIAVAVIASIQLAVALGLQARYDRSSLRTLLLGPLYPLAYWALNAAAAIHSGVRSLARGATAERGRMEYPARTRAR